MINLFLDTFGTVNGAQYVDPVVLSELAHKNPKKSSKFKIS